jgi:hypothetical protein
MLAAPAGHGAHPMGYCNFVSRDEINKMHISLSFFICVFRYTGTPAFFVTFRVKQIGTPGGTWFSSHLCCATMVVGFISKLLSNTQDGSMGHLLNQGGVIYTPI